MKEITFGKMCLVKKPSTAKYILMKTIALALLFLFPFVFFSCFAQEKKLPEQMLCSSVLLITDKGGGSGLFMTDTNYVYFVTARHNLFSERTINIKGKLDTVFSLMVDTGKFIFYPHDIVTDEQAIISVNFKCAYDDSLIKYDKHQDIAVMILAKRISPSSISYYKNCIQKDRSTNIYPESIFNTRKYSEINIGGEIYLFGYPTSIGQQQIPQFDYFRPLLRKGIIAGKYEKNKSIIIDSPAYYGNSGGPVYEIADYGLQSEAFLIGIVSQFIPYIDQWQNKSTGYTNIQTINSGYSALTSIEYAIQLIKEFKIN